jgi:16S rRNA (cytidine1402-2'-O)-methyltransferase
VSCAAGVLYVVATPLGNLGDITYRAVEVLKTVDLVTAEDTRHSRKLLGHYGIQTPMLSLHTHNEQEQTLHLIELLGQGKKIALISDAGTPLISDPGFILVREVHQQGGRVIPIPGPSAVIAALSVAGLPTDRFVFEGFLSSKAVARATHLHALREEPRTLVFYEAPHRILETLSAMVTVFGAQRDAVLVRELTKTYETVCAKPLGELRDWVAEHAEQQLGEIVLLVQGATAAVSPTKCEIEVETLLTQLLAHVSVKTAAQVTAAVTGLGKNALYDRALQLTQHDE